ncbi:MAG: hypothetical protein JO006_19940 [Paucibacter sp.]|nr:hypothetical protein [Roseateles sp.]
MSILCIGGANIDRKLRLLQAAHPGSSNPAFLSECPGGVARNVASNLLALGLPVRLLTAVGDDDDGRALLEPFDSQGSVIARGVSDSYTAVLDTEGRLVIGLAAMPLVDELRPEKLPTDLPALTVFDLNLPAASVEALLARAGRSRLLAVAVSEPKMNRLPLDLRGLHALLLNEGELAQTPGLADLHARGVARIAVTLGLRGVMISEAGSAPITLSAPRVTVIDVTGAGDAFAAGVCAGLRENEDWEACCRRGLALASAVLQSTASTL